MRRVLAALLAVAMTGCVTKVVREPAEPKPEMRVWISPIGFVLGPYPADKVLIGVQIDAGTPFWCPKLEIEWFPGQSSTHEEDCDPANEGQAYSYSVAGPAKKFYFVPTPIRVTLSQGQHSSSLTLMVQVN